MLFGVGINLSILNEDSDFVSIPIFTLNRSESNMVVFGSY